MTLQHIGGIAQYVIDNGVRAAASLIAVAFYLRLRNVPPAQKAAIVGVLMIVVLVVGYAGDGDWRVAAASVAIVAITIAVYERRRGRL